MNISFSSSLRGLVHIDNLAIPFIVRYSPRAKRRYSYRLDNQAGLIVTVPRGSDPKAALAALTKKREWLLDSLERNQPAPTRLLGEPLTISIHDSYKGQPKLIDRTLVLPKYCDHEAQVLRWYKQQTKNYLEQQLPLLAQKMGVVPHKVTIKDQRTRWGSCSSIGTLSFNWRLVMAPSSVFDALIVHELAHLRELNHSPRFWAIVQEHCPGHAQAVAWLHAHGPGIRAWRYSTEKESD